MANNAPCKNKMEKLKTFLNESADALDFSPGVFIYGVRHTLGGRTHKIEKELNDVISLGCEDVKKITRINIDNNNFTDSDVNWLSSFLVNNPSFSIQELSLRQNPDITIQSIKPFVDKLPHIILNLDPALMAEYEILKPKIIKRKPMPFTLLLRKIDILTSKMNEMNQKLDLLSGKITGGRRMTQKRRMNKKRRTKCSRV